MELLLRTNFDIPKPPGGVFDPLRYLSLGQEASREEVRTTSATSVYEVARPILQGCHAIPTKLKILLDRALSALAQEEVLMIVSGCGWQLDDYQRGYKLKDAAGSPLDRWNMVTKAEEPLILQQFLLFRETRNITQQLVIQDLAERSFNPLEKREMERRREEEKNKEEMQKEENLPERRDSLLQMVQQQPPKKEERMSPPPREVSPPKMSSPPRLNPSPPPPAKLAPSSPAPQNNQPAAPIFPRSLANGIPLPPSSMSMSNLMSNHFPMFPFPGLPNGLPNGLNQHKDPPNSSALNLTGKLSEKQMREEREEMDSDSGSRRSSIDVDINKRTSLPDDLGISFVSPTTGKKRVQCNVCMKTFCDKGALKIHFSAVHLREMHKCTMHGCNMMFSSRRSRNRHSANPNPKLHTPQVKRRISQNDGRTHPGPNLGINPSPITPILPKESPVKEAPREPPAGFPQLPPGFPHPGMPGFPPGFPGLNLPGFNPFMPPDLKTLQQDLQRFSDLSKLFPQPANGEQRSDSSESGVDSGNRKRKSQNPTKRPHLDMEESEHISSDSASDEGFPDPMMEDDDDDLGDVSSGDDAA